MYFYTVAIRAECVRNQHLLKMRKLSRSSMSGGEGSWYLYCKYIQVKRLDKIKSRLLLKSYRLFRSLFRFCNYPFKMLFPLFLPLKS